MNFSLYRDTPPLARWLIGIGGFLVIGLLAPNGCASVLNAPVPFAAWQVQVIQCLAYLLWGTGLIITAVVLQRREQQPPLFKQLRLWFGLLCFAILPDGAMLALQQSHVVSEGPVPAAIILLSIMGCLCCLSLGVYFWRQKRRMHMV
jgi:hypothetical protein